MESQHHAATDREWEKEAHPLMREQTEEEEETGGAP